MPGDLHRTGGGKKSVGCSQGTDAVLDDLPWLERDRKFQKLERSQSKSTVNRPVDDPSDAGNESCHDDDAFEDHCAEVRFLQAELAVENAKSYDDFKVKMSVGPHVITRSSMPVDGYVGVTAQEIAVMFCDACGLAKSAALRFGGSSHKYTDAEAGTLARAW